MIVKDSVIETYTGKFLDLLDPKPEEIDIRDIAHSLSMQCRFTGHTRSYYSVAEHCVRCSEYARKVHTSPMLALQCLFHDAAEAYLSDVSTPLKKLLPAYSLLEDDFMRVILKKFDVDPNAPKLVKEIDIVMLENESYHLLPSKGGSWGIELLIPACDSEPYCWNPEQAEYSFLVAYWSIINEIYIARRELQRKQTSYDTPFGFTSDSARSGTNVAGLRSYNERSN
jgi:uncharacterized protein